MDNIAVAVIFPSPPTVSRETVGVLFSEQEKGPFHVKQHQNHPSYSRQAPKLSQACVSRETKRHLSPSAHLSLYIKAYK